MGGKNFCRFVRVDGDWNIFAADFRGVFWVGNFGRRIWGKLQFVKNRQIFGANLRGFFLAGELRKG